MRRRLLPLLLTLALFAVPASLALTSAGAAAAAPKPCWQLNPNHPRWCASPSPTPTTPPPTTPPPTTPPPVTGFGTDPTITCPVPSVLISTTVPDIQTFIQSYPAGTAFCIEAGVHNQTRTINPRTGDSFTGQYGAILDGGTPATFTITSVGGCSFCGDALFVSHNQNNDDVTIRNLVLRDAPVQISELATNPANIVSERWTVDHNELGPGWYGMDISAAGSVVSNNWIHDNIKNPESPTPAERGGAYGGYKAVNVTWLHNEIGPGNGPEQKICCGASGVVFRDNYVHDNDSNGLWYDGDNVNSIVEGNLVANNPGVSINIEISGSTIVRNNTVTGAGLFGLFISSSQDVEAYNNTFTNNANAIVMFLEPSIVGAGLIGFDLKNNYIHDNTVTTIGTQNAVSFSACCGSVTTPEYFRADGGKNNRFDFNHYDVPDPATSLVWTTGGTCCTTRYTFAQWQTLGQDPNGSVS